MKSLLKTAILFLVLCTTVYGQSVQEFLNFDFVGGGARAAGMGNAYLALSNDVTAGSWNPAGLDGLEGPILGATFGSMMPRGYTDIDVQSNLFRYDHGGSLSSMNSMNFVAPFRIKGHPFVGSFNYTTNFQGYIGSIYALDLDYEAYVTRNNISGVLDTFDLHQETQSVDEGGVRSVNFSFGTRIYNNVSAGLAVNIYTGESTIETNIAETIFEYPVDPGEQEVTLVSDFLEVDTLKYSGVNFTLGLKYDGNVWDAGLVVRTPFALNVKTGISQYTVLSINGLPREEGTDTTFYDNLLTKYTMPMMVGTGLAWHRGENFTAALDMEYRGFESSKIKTRTSLIIDPSGNNEEVFEELDPEWNNVFAMRYGVEYLWKTGIGVVPLRFGAGIVPIPSPNNEDVDAPSSVGTVPSMILKPIVKLFNKDETPLTYTMSVGSGIRWSQIFVEWAYTYSAVNRDFAMTNVASEIQDHQFSVMFTGYF